MEQLKSDFDFALEDTSEFVSKNGGWRAPLLRYVAALNPEATSKEFVAAAIKKGFNAATAYIQFQASRKFDLQNNDRVGMEPDGRLYFY